MVVTLIAATAADDQVPPPARMARVGELPAMLAGVARAVQNVQDEALRRGPRPADARPGDHPRGVAGARRPGDA